MTVPVQPSVVSAIPDFIQTQQDFVISVALTVIPAKIPQHVLPANLATISLMEPV